MLSMTTTVPKTKLLEHLRKNRSEHKQIVAEARDGYLRQAKEELEKRLEQLRHGKLVSLHFDLTPPRDYTHIYDQAIEMLEWNTATDVVLQADEFDNIVRDNWNWMREFLTSNSLYSATATAKLHS